MAECSVSLAVRRARRLRPLNAFITELFNAAEREAKLRRERLERNRCKYGSTVQPSTAGEDRAVFPIAVKDCFSTAGVRTTCGSRMLANYVPSFSATAVLRLQQAGGVMVGKTNMDEFCMGTTTTNGYFGPAKNPYTLVARPDMDLTEDWLVAGGSSGGSAIAVACGMAKGSGVPPGLGLNWFALPCGCRALASDTGGSTRNPAALCGVVGVKPTYGLVSRHGLVPLVNSLDCPALITQNVQDAAWALDLLAGRDAHDMTSVDRPLASFQNYPRSTDAVSKLRIGIPHEYYHERLSAGAFDAWNAAALALERRAGCALVPVSMPHTHWSILCYHVLGDCDVASNMARYDGVEYGHRSDAAGSELSVEALYSRTRAEGFNEVVRRRILAGNFFLLREQRGEFFERAAKVRRLIAADHAAVFSGDSRTPVDVLLTPAASDASGAASQYLAGGGERGYERERVDDFYTQPANMAGVPALVLPVTKTADGRPLAVQLAPLPDPVKCQMSCKVSKVMSNVLENGKFTYAILQRILLEFLHFAWRLTVYGIWECPLVADHFSEAKLFSVAHWLQEYFQFESLCDLIRSDT